MSRSDASSRQVRWLQRPAAPVPDGRHRHERASCCQDSTTAPETQRQALDAPGGVGGSAGANAGGTGSGQPGRRDAVRPVGPGARAGHEVLREYRLAHNKRFAVALKDAQPAWRKAPSDHSDYRVFYDGQSFAWARGERPKKTSGRAARRNAGWRNRGTTTWGDTFTEQFRGDIFTLLCHRIDFVLDAFRGRRAPPIADRPQSASLSSLSARTRAASDAGDAKRVPACVRAAERRSGGFETPCYESL